MAVETLENLALLDAHCLPGMDMSMKRVLILELGRRLSEQRHGSWLWQHRGGRRQPQCLPERLDRVQRVRVHPCLSV